MVAHVIFNKASSDRQQSKWFHFFLGPRPHVIPYIMVRLMRGRRLDAWVRSPDGGVGSSVKDSHCSVFVSVTEVTR